MPNRAIAGAIIGVLLLLSCQSSEEAFEQEHTEITDNIMSIVYTHEQALENGVTPKELLDMCPLIPEWQRYITTSLQFLDDHPAQFADAVEAEDVINQVESIVELAKSSCRELGYDY